VTAIGALFARGRGRRTFRPTRVFFIVVINFRRTTMKQLSIALITSLTTLLVSVPLHADEAHHKDDPKKSVVAPAQPPAAAASADREKRMQGMQMNMIKMHEQMHKIMQAKDPKERQRLMQEHLKMMQDHMKMMGGNMGGMMGGDMHRMMPGGGSNPSGTQAPHAK
jgi:hypothetical protein